MQEASRRGCDSLEQSASQSPEEEAGQGECGFCGKAGGGRQRVGRPVGLRGPRVQGRPWLSGTPSWVRGAGGSWLRAWVPPRRGEGPGSLSVYCKSAPGGPDPAPGRQEQGV